MNIEKQITEALTPEVEKLAVTIESVKLEKENDNLFLRIVIDANNPVDVDKCVGVTNVVNPILDNMDLIEEAYILDISTKEKGR